MPSRVARRDHGADFGGADVESYDDFFARHFDSLENSPLRFYPTTVRPSRPNLPCSQVKTATAALNSKCDLNLREQTRANRARREQNKGHKARLCAAKFTRHWRNRRARFRRQFSPRVWPRLKRQRSMSNRRSAARLLKNAPGKHHDGADHHHRNAPVAHAGFQAQTARPAAPIRPPATR